MLSRWRGYSFMLFHKRECILAMLKGTGEYPRQYSIVTQKVMVFHAFV